MKPITDTLNAKCLTSIDDFCDAIRDHFIENSTAELHALVCNLVPNTCKTTSRVIWRGKIVFRVSDNSPSVVEEIYSMLAQFKPERLDTTRSYEWDIFNAIYLQTKLEGVVYDNWNPIRTVQYHISVCLSDFGLSSDAKYNEYKWQLPGLKESDIAHARKMILMSLELPQATLA